MVTVPLRIAGGPVESAGGRYIVKTCRLTGEPIARVAAATRADAERAVDAAADGGARWAATSPGARREVLERAAELLDERSDAISAMMGKEMGAAASWCHFNVKLAAGMLREAAAQVYSTVGQVIPSDVPGLTALAVREPVGVVVGIAPWNAPMILGVRAIAMPLAYGNTVVLKASEETPATHAAIIECLIDAGIPAGAANLVTNAAEDAAEVVDALISHKAVRCVNFTGSTTVGRIIAEKAGRHLKRTVLELGGKAPFLVLADADLDAAAAAASFGAFMNQGQICMSTERLIVDRAVAAEFTELWPSVPRSWSSATPRITAHNSAAGARGRGRPRRGAGRRCGGPRCHGRHRRQAGRPVLPADRADAVSPPPPGSTPRSRSVRSPRSSRSTGGGGSARGQRLRVRFVRRPVHPDVAQGLRLARRIQSGICHINGATVHDEAQMPFGGVSPADTGVSVSAALEEFTELRWITVSSEHRHYPI